MARLSVVFGFCLFFVDMLVFSFREVVKNKNFVSSRFMCCKILFIIRVVEVNVFCSIEDFIFVENRGI